MTTVSNPNGSSSVALVMRLLADTVHAEAGGQTHEVSRQAPGEKGSILVEVIVGLGVAATWDAIKYCAHRIADLTVGVDDVISVDGEQRQLGELDPNNIKGDK